MMLLFIVDKLLLIILHHKLLFNQILSLVFLLKFNKRIMIDCCFTVVVDHWTTENDFLWFCGLWLHMLLSVPVRSAP
jgi:hypothetical protein